VSKSLTLLIFAALFLAGCATAPDQPEEVISSPPIPPDGTSALNWSDTHLVKKPPAAVPVRPIRPSARANSPAVAPMTTWTSLNRWAAENKLGAPRKVSSTPVATYAISSTNGVLALTIGSREATWNGVEIQLGFVPEFIDDQIFIYGLDLQKNIEPLLTGVTPGYGNHVIVIDPGHGGINAGTHSVVDGRLEKEFTLDWALRLAPLLATNGWRVFLTRTNDTDVSLSNRVAFAEAHQADLFISLHFNSGAPDEKPAGLETYCLTPTGTPSTLTRGYPDVWSQVFPNNAYDAQNLQFGIRLHKAILHATSLEDRGVCRARFIGVLHGQHRPAVLIEAGYLSNPHEAKMIENTEFRQKLAEAVAAALK